MPTAASLHTKTAIASTIADFKGLDDWIEVFRSGTHVDSKGVERTFTNADLDKVVANHALGAAPAVLGHPEDNDPAYAWVDEIKRDGDSLFVKFRDINPAFAQAVEKKAYANRSVSLYQDKKHGLRLRHVGWLGAALPALDGLKPVEFAADADAELIEFTGECDAVRSLIWASQNVASLFRGFREYLIEQSGVEAADKVVPGWAIDNLTSSAERASAALDAENQPAFTAPTPNGGDMPATPEEIARIKAEAKAEAEAAATAAAEAKFAAQGKDLAELRKQRKEESIGAKVKAWKAAGLVTPAEEPALREFMSVLEDHAGDFTFSSGEGATAAQIKKTPKDFFAEFMGGRKPVVKLGKDGRVDDDVVQETDEDPRAVADKAHAFIAEQAKVGITVQLHDAVAKFSKQPVA